MSHGAVNMGQEFRGALPLSIYLKAERWQRSRQARVRGKKRKDPRSPSRTRLTFAGFPPSHSRFASLYPAASCSPPPPSCSFHSTPHRHSLPPRRHRPAPSSPPHLPDLPAPEPPPARFQFRRRPPPARRSGSRPRASPLSLGRPPAPPRARSDEMSCFVCFGSAAHQDGEPRKPADASKDPAPDRGLARLGSDKSRSHGGPDSKKDLIIRSDGNSQNIAAQTFTFRDLAAATKNFRQDCLLGEGGFGRVYKGRLDTGQAVAVKQLDRNGLQGNREFLVEVLMLSLLHHTNLVNLIGYCADGDQRLLVYEFMPLGSLEDHLHDLPPDKEPLDWNTRMKIAAGAAKGLEYLHDKASPPVIYRDFKSSNILLGEGFHPKLSDFGLAKLGPVGDKTHVSTRVMGTYGYCAPEYAMTGQLTVKSDVYSFGVVFLELITGRKAIDNTKPQGEQNLVAWARPLFKDRRKFPKMADPMLQGRFPMRGLYQALAVAAMCLQEQAATRPHIGDVVTALSYLASQAYDPNAPVQHSRSNSSTPRARNPAGWNTDQRSARSPNHHSPDPRRRDAARSSKYGAEVSRTSSTGDSGRRSGLDDMDMTGSLVGSPAQTGRRETPRAADRQRAIAEAKMWGENSRERSNGHGSFDSTNE